MRWAILLLVVGCTSSGGSSSGFTHVDCTTGGNCTEDHTLTGVCAQDRSHLCFCTKATAPSTDCISNAVKPSPPNTVAYCCP